MAGSALTGQLPASASADAHCNAVSPREVAVPTLKPEPAAADVPKKIDNFDHVIVLFRGGCRCSRHLPVFVSKRAGEQLLWRCAPQAVFDRLSSCMYAVC